ISCHQQVWETGGKILSCSDAIAKALEIYHLKDTGGNGNGKKKPVYEETMLIGQCPECGSCVDHEGGCAVCRNCGFTKCSG
nr:hypothetical protein [Nitrospiraceae bacterium]